MSENVKPSFSKISFKNKDRKYKNKDIIRVVLGTTIVLITIFYVYMKFFYAVPDAEGKKVSKFTSSTAAKSEAKDNVVRVKAQNVVAAGDIPDITKFEIVEVPVSLIPKDAVKSINDLKGMRVKNYVGENEFLVRNDLMPENAWYEPGDRLVEHNFPEGSVPAAVVPGSQIDVKLFKQGAQDTTVIAKIAVVSRNANLLAFYLNDLEQEYIKEAATEGVFYVTQYINDTQPANEVTYVPDYGSDTKQKTGGSNSGNFSNAPNLQ